MSTSKKVSGTQKVAAFLLALDKEVSAKVMRGLDPKVISDVAEAMTELDPELCTPEAVDELFKDLARTVYQRSGVRPQDEIELHTILANTFGAEEAERVLAEIHERRRVEQPFGFLESVPVGHVARVLEQESAPIVALVLSHVSPTVSAEVLGRFEPEVALDIVKRMTTIVPPAVETMLTIADDLEQRLAASDSGAPRTRADSLRTIAELLGYSDGETERLVLEGLEGDDEQTANEIRDFMFTWEDLADVEKRNMQKILASVDTRTLAMALKGSSAAVQDNIMSNLSSRVCEMITDERTLLGAVPFSEVATARDELRKAVRVLIEAGEFTPARAGEELVT